jgi:acid phosphatase type 7
LNGQVPVTFKTPPETGKELKFAATGDPHFGNPASNGNVTRQILKYVENPDNNYSMLFVLGDTVHLGFMDSLWKEAFAAISTCSSSVPVSYVIGNHDTLFGGLELYQDYLCPPAGADEREKCLYKRFDINNVHFLVLDLEWETETYTPREEQWLIQQLQSIPRNDWLVVMSHTFYYGSGLYQYGWAWYDNQKTIAKLTPLFEKYGVDLVLSGHKHQTEVLQKNGITYVIAGSFGGPEDPERTYTSPASTWYKAGQFGFADITIGGTSGSLIMRSPEGMELFKTAINNR